MTRTPVYIKLSCIVINQVLKFDKTPLEDCRASNLADLTSMLQRGPARSDATRKPWVLKGCMKPFFYNAITILLGGHSKTLPQY